MTTPHPISWLNMPGFQGQSWNPATGCTPVSEGCAHCYAKRLAETRLRGRCGYPADDPFRVTLHPNRLEQPLHWRNPRMIFVEDMGDLFHPDVPFEYLDKVLAVAALCPQHVFCLLTKRAERMREYFSYTRGHGNVLFRITNAARSMEKPASWDGGWAYGWPLPNVWMGVTVENQGRANERISVLLDTPAAVRFVSCEPLLGQTRLDCLGIEDSRYINALEGTAWDDVNGDLCTEADGEVPIEMGLDWVICGGESGKDARPMHPDWARSMRDQCAEAGVPFFFKQWGEWAPHPKRFLNSGLLGMGCVGTRKAGDLLDGVQHHNWPEVAR